MCLNSSLLGQNGRHYADDIFRCIFVNEIFCILVEITLKFVPKSPIDKKTSIGLDTAIIWTNPDPIDWRIYAALHGDGLNLEKPLHMLYIVRLRHKNSLIDVWIYFNQIFPCCLLVLVVMKIQDNRNYDTKIHGSLNHVFWFFQVSISISLYYI